MTKMQNTIYACIKSFVDKNGYAPSIRELCSMTGLRSTATVYHHLRTLRKEGLIDYVDGKARTIVVLE